MNVNVRTFYLFGSLSLAVFAGVAVAAADAPGWQTLAPTTVPRVEEVVGNLQPRMVTTLSSKVMGNVLEVLKREGDAVAVDEVVVRIDAKDLGNELAGAQAAVSEAGAAAVEVEQQIAAAQAGLASAKAQAGLAADNLRRIEQLFAAKSATQAELDGARTQARQADEAVRQADAQIAALGARKAQVAARAGQARAAVGKVSTIKSLAEVRAPFAGRVTRRFVEPGMLAAPGAPLLGVEEHSQILFEAIVPEQLLSHVTEGASMAVRVDAVPGVVFAGTVVEIVPAGDRLSHTFMVKVGIERDPRLRSGMFARGEVVKGDETPLLVPAAAVETRGQLQGVYVEHDGKPVYRLIRVGRVFDDQIEVLAGLTPGERFAADAASVRRSQP